VLIREGLLALPGREGLLRADLLVRGERIAAIGQDLPCPEGETTLDARGLLVFPAAIDPHVHFDEPGFTWREDFLHGTAEAARGGVGTIIDMPCTSLPPVTTAEALENKLAAVAGKALVDFAFFGGVSGASVEEALSGSMAALAPKVVGFKSYFISGMESFTSLNHDDFPRVLAEAARLGRPLLLHAEDLDFVRSAEARYAKQRASTGRAPSWEDYLSSRGREAELVAVASALALARAAGAAAALHVVHLGTAEAALAIHEAGATCETCAHYLAFTGADYERLGAALKTAPPVKSAADREGLWGHLASGAVDFLASDHAPAPRSEKETGDPLTAYGGIPGTGTGFPFLLSEGYFAGRLALPRFLEASSGAAARRYGLSARKGALAVGMDADFVLVDPSETTVVEGAGLFSLGRVTPFEGMRLKGRVRGTWVRGTRVYDAGADSGIRGPTGLPSSIVASPGHGKFLSWGYR